MRQIVLFLIFWLLCSANVYATIIDYYVDWSKADDTGNGLSWANAKKTIYGCIQQVVTDLDGQTSDSATINISGGTSGRTYAETHNLILSKGTHYPDVGGGSLTLHDGASGKEWTIKGSSEAAHSGQVTIDATGISTWQTYTAAIPTYLDYTQIQNVSILNGNIGYDDIFFSGAEYGLVEDNILEDYGKHAINIDDSENSVVRRNSVKGANADGNSSGIKILNDGRSDTTKVYNNVVNVAGGTGASYHFGIQAYDAQDVEIYNNTIYGAHKIGVGLLGTSGNGADNSIVKNNVISSSDNYEIFIDGNTSGITSDYNCIYRSSGAIGYIGGTFTAGGGPTGGSEKTWAQWQTDGYDANGINTEPLAGWVDYANGDFRIRNSASNLYNAGTDLSGSGITDDIQNTPRPQFTTYDIGAFEYSGKSSSGGTSGGPVISIGRYLKIGDGLHIGGD
jgi:hypothetical protein